MPQAIEPAVETFAKIKVVGVGGAGGAAVNRMADAGIDGVEYIAVNTDSQALHNSKADIKLHIGKDTTRGLGAGADPTVGQRAAEESKDEIRKVLQGADMVFVTIGAGGGTGSGAGYIVAQLAKEQGALVVGFATKPFAFEGEKRRRNADQAIDNLRRSVDTLIIIPNDRLLQTIDRQTPLLEAFRVADDVLRQGIQGISDLITVHGLINLDFADVKAVMSNAGTALMGIGRASGENRAITAAQQAIESPLLEVSIDGARGIIFNVIGGNDLAMHEINAAAETITNAADPDANIIFGATINPELEGEVIITVVATGFDASYFTKRQVGAAAPAWQDGTMSDDDDDESPAETPESMRSNPVMSLSKDDEKEMSDLDVNLDDRKSGDEVIDFKSDDLPPNIWTVENDQPTVSGPAPSVTTGGKPENDDEDELDRPSFLRRLKGFSRHTPNEKSDDSSENLKNKP